MLKIATLTFGLFGVNTYVVWNTDTLDAAVIDPGMMNAREDDVFDSYIAKHGLHVTQLINTHMHVDHIFGNRHVAERYNVKAAGGEADLFLGQQAPAQARMFQLPVSLEPVGLDIILHDGEMIDVCGEQVEVLSVPGHSPGSIALYFAESGWVITGDVLFKGSVGRTDLIAGNHAALLKSIHTKLMSLPPMTVVYSGHGEPTTIMAESTSNPYIRQ